jgi:integrase
MDRRQEGVRAKSASSIQIDFAYQGMRHRETMKLPPTKANLLFAVNKRAAVLHEIAMGKFNYAEHFPNSRYAATLGKLTNKTIGEALEDFLRNTKRKYEASTIRGYKSAIYHHLMPAFGKTPICKLTTNDIKDWINSLTVSGKRINNVLIPLRIVLSDAYFDGLIDSNPADRIKNVPHRYPEPNPFKKDEMQLILDNCVPQTRNLFQFAFWSGLRTSELIALEWDDIDFVKGVVRVTRASVKRIIKQPKTHAGKREVLILPLALEALERQKEFTFSIGGRIFHNPLSNAPWDIDNQIRYVGWLPALTAAGVAYRNPYQTRHTYASMLLSAGENPMWVAQQMGHADWGMIRKRYGRWIPDQNSTAGSKVIAHWSQNSHGMPLTTCI